MSSRAHIDRFFLLSVGLLTVAGFIIFLSASLGLLVKTGVSFGTVALKQLISLGAGIALFYIFSRVRYGWWRKAALFVLIGAVAFNLLLFIPGLALYYGGASRWLVLGPLSIQPSEFLKIAFIIYLAAWIHFAKDKIKRVRWGIVPYIVIMAILGTLMIIQSDTDTLVIIAGTGLIMLVIAGVPLRHIGLAGLLIVALVGGVILFRPYALTRVKVFLNPSESGSNASYQIDQSMIAIGSGGLFGRGFGQSIQKFGYLPQPTDDSIFAVAAEEFGFAGTIVLIALYLCFAGSTFRVATRAPDVFGGMVAIGIGVLVVTESFLNMAAMLGLVPLSGVPLLFVSHGGTALVIALAAAGIVANISKSRK